MSKRCNRCKDVKPFKQFHHNKGTKDGLTTICIDCMKIAKAGKPKQKASPGVWRRAKLRMRYGLTDADYDSMRKAQRGLCAICLFPHAELNIDHCHETGKIRGLLCNKCNTGIGMLRDDPEVLLAAVAYLEKYLVNES